MNIKVGMVSLGCPKNQVDGEMMLSKARDAGFQIIADPALADVVIINTCGFIQSAKEEAIENILEFAALKKEGRIKKVIATGCLAERYRDEVKKEIPELDAVVGIGANGDIADIIKRCFAGEEVETFPDKVCLPMSGKRILTSLPFFAYLKIAEGCDNRCSYCAIPAIRGRYRSRPMEEILDEARSLAGHGVKELVVVAQDTTRYGQDLYGEYKLAELLKKLSALDGLKWIRVLYAYPERITGELLQVIRDEDKIVKYLDIPLQHASARILKAMNRHGDGKALSAQMAHIREAVPGIVLRTTLITGFPGETEEDFAELTEFVKQNRFDRLGCFAYSEEEGTPAASMPHQVPEEVRRRRAEVIMAEQLRIHDEKNREKIGAETEVVVEGFDRYAECFFGRGTSDAPDIDTKVYFTGKKKLSVGQFVKIHIDDVLEYDLIGTVCGEEV